MIKSLKALTSQERTKYTIPKTVHDFIPITTVYEDGLFRVGNWYTKSFRFADINYLVASQEDKKEMFIGYAELLNSLDSSAVSKITINNHRLNHVDFEKNILLPDKSDSLAELRREYNGVLSDKASEANGIVQEKYLTISVNKKSVEDAQIYFGRVAAELGSHFSSMGSKMSTLDGLERLRILHDFYRAGEEAYFTFDFGEKARKGHDFRDYISPDYIERHDDYIKLGDKYARVLFLKDYASFIKDIMVSELTELNRNLMFSIDIVPIPTDEAVREVESRLLSVETNITNWVRHEVA